MAEETVKRFGRSGSQFVAGVLAAHGLLFVQCVSLALAWIAAAECHTIVTQSVPDAPLLPSVLYGLVLWCWWGIIGSVIWKLAGKRPKDFFSFPSMLKHLVAGVLLAGAHVWLLQWTVNWLTAHWPVLGPAGYSSLDYINLNRFFFELLLYGFVVGVTGVIHLQFASQSDAMHALSLEKQLSFAHLRALQMQIEPHFLFNTLNAITSLVELNRREQALQTLEHLNSILKSTLGRNTPEKVSLAQELELVDDYLSIEEIRFEDRLQVSMIVDPGALDSLVPCFLLQPIVENAIRHGISRCEESGIVQVTAERRGARLYLEVRDSGPGMDGQASPGYGIGLKNTRERLALFYPEQFALRTGMPATGGFEVVIDIPYESAA